MSIIGKGMKQRLVALNKDVREAYEDYLKVRPATSLDYLFVGQRGQLTRNGVFKTFICSSLCLTLVADPLRHFENSETSSHKFLQLTI